MTKENWKTIINVICTILSAISAAFCTSSCAVSHSNLLTF